MQIPPEVQSVVTALTAAGFEAYVVGGCVRDIFLQRNPSDWDITTNALPADIQQIFPKNFYNNRFGTVTVLTSSQDEQYKEIEVTTYRIDANYSDQRHPDHVEFTEDIVQDLARRDFTINAMAAVASNQESATADTPFSLSGRRDGDEGHRETRRRAVRNQDAVTIDGLTVIDPFGGLQDLNAKVIRAVGDPGARFAEDALRLLRAIRFAAQLNFTIENETQKDITAYAPSIHAVSAERIRDELIKIVLSNHPEYGFNLLATSGLLAIILPELQEGINVGQNKHHIYTVFDHNIKSLQFAAQFNYSLEVRLASLLHDIGKPRTRRFVPTKSTKATVQGEASHQKNGDYTFYGHDIVGARMTEKLLRRLKFPNQIIDKVTHLVRHHMFYYDVGKVTEAGARRLLRRVGPEHFDDLIKLRIAERKGSGVPKAEPYRLRHLQFLVEKAAQAPISVTQLKIRGTDLIRELKLKPGPQIGGILNALLAEVLDDPEKNERDYLLLRAKELQDIDPSDLKAMGETAKDNEEQKREGNIKRKYHV